MTEVDPNASVTPTTTVQQDMTLAGQRRINLIWEYTQAGIALLVVVACILSALVYVINHTPGDIPQVLSNAMFLIVGFYFSRTNHAAIGGVGPKANQNVNEVYRGR